MWTEERGKRLEYWASEAVCVWACVCGGGLGEPSKREDESQGQSQRRQRKKRERDWLPKKENPTNTAWPLVARSPNTHKYIPFPRIEPTIFVPLCSYFRYRLRFRSSIRAPAFTPSTPYSLLPARHTTSSLPPSYPSLQLPTLTRILMSPATRTSSLSPSAFSIKHL